MATVVIPSVPSNWNADLDADGGITYVDKPVTFAIPAGTWSSAVWAISGNVDYRSGHSAYTNAGAHQSSGILVLGAYSDSWAAGGDQLSDINAIAGGAPPDLPVLLRSRVGPAPTIAYTDHVAACTLTLTGTPYVPPPIPGTQTDGSLDLLRWPITHSLRAWGHPVGHVLNIGEVGAGQAVGSLLPRGCFISPYPYAYLYDIVFSVAGHEGGPALATVDLWDTFGAGSATGNSYLATPWSLTGASAMKGASARFTAVNPPYFPLFDPTRFPGSQIQRWTMESYKAGTRSIPLSIPQGQIFSVRCATTGGSGYLTGLAVTVVLVPSDNPIITNK